MPRPPDMAIFLLTTTTTTTRPITLPLAHARGVITVGPSQMCAIWNSMVGEFRNSDCTYHYMVGNFGDVLNLEIWRIGIIIIKYSLNECAAMVVSI